MDNIYPEFEINTFREVKSRGRKGVTITLSTTHRVEFSGVTYYASKQYSKNIPHPFSYEKAFDIVSELNTEAFTFNSREIEDINETNKHNQRIYIRE